MPATSVNLIAVLAQKFAEYSGNLFSDDPSLGINTQLNNYARPFTLVFVAWAAVRSKAVVLLLIGTPIVGFCICSMFCYALLYVHSSFAIILMGKRELVALRSFSSWCLVIVVWLFLACHGFVCRL